MKLNGWKTNHRGRKFPRVIKFFNWIKYVLYNQLEGNKFGYDDYWAKNFLEGTTQQRCLMYVKYDENRQKEFRGSPNFLRQKSCRWNKFESIRTNTSGMWLHQQLPVFNQRECWWERRRGRSQQTTLFLGKHKDDNLDYHNVNANFN